MAKVQKKLNKTQEPLNDMLFTIDKLYKEDQKNVKPQKNSLAELVFKNKSEELSQKLQDNIEDLDIRDDMGETISWTPLYWAVKFRHIECVKILLEYGASINTVVTDLDECCGTVLDLAMLRGDEEIEAILREFIEKGSLSTTNSPYKAIRTKLRGKAPAFNFAYYGKSVKK